MIAADDVNTSPYANNLYAGWTAANNLFVQFNRSTNGASTFSAPINLTAYWGQGANVQTGPNGEVYVCWADYNGNNILNNWTSNGLGFCSSLNGGANFSAPLRVINYTGIRQFNNVTNDDKNPNFNMTRVNDFPSMAVDKSNGSHRGRIYVALPVRQNGNGKAIIQVSFSDNKGVTWSTPVTVSISNGRQNWLPWISVDAATGLVYIVYYSFDQSSGNSTNTYVATSSDGGTTYTNQKVSSVSHITSSISPYASGYAGDYIGITSYGWKAYAAWMDNRTGQWQDYVLKLDNTPKINGVTAFCNTATYTLSNLVSGFNGSIIWSASPNGIVSLMPNGNSVKATKLTQGDVTLTATFNSTTSSSVSFDITTKPKITTINYNMQGPCNDGIQTWSVTAVPNMAWGSSIWSVDNSNSGIFIYNINSLTTFMDVSHGGGVTINYSDACGEPAPSDGVTIYSPCGHSYSISPNPATSIVAISAIIPRYETTSTSLISQINIYDQQGVLKMHKTFGKVEKAKINVCSLQTGIYIIQIIDGINKDEQKLQILH